MYPDLGIKQVEQKNNDAKIIIANKGGLPVPIYLTIKTDNGQTTTMHYGADVWKNGNGADYIIMLKNYTGKIRSVKLGNDLTPDKNREDNIWEMK